MYLPRSIPSMTLKILGDYHLSSETALRELDLLKDILDEAARREVKRHFIPPRGLESPS